MSKGLVTGTHLTNIANAIRTKLGVQTTYQPSQMAAAIESIPTGGSNVIDLSTGIKFGGSTFTTLPSYIANADWSVVTDMYRYFQNCSLSSIPLLDTSNVTRMSSAFNAGGSFTSFPLLNTSNVTQMNNMFADCQLLTTIPLIDTSNVTTMSSMFQRCYALTEVPLINTGKVTNMQQMFRSCSALTTVPQLDTSAVTGPGMVGMFTSCTALSNTSLNNILAMCINATQITNTNYMTLKSVGLTSGQALICEGLSNWSAFLAAGWTSGY